MFKRGYSSSRAVSPSHRSWFVNLSSRFALIAVLLLAGALLLPASETDDKYYQIYGLIEQADAFGQGGQADKALVKYRAAEKELKALKQNYPLYNPKLVTTRLNYLAEKITTLAKPAEPEIETSARKEISEAPVLKPVIPGQPPIKLLEAGAEPRKAFRLHATVADVQKIKLTIRMKMGVVAPDLPSEMMTLPPMTMAATVTIKEVKPTGDTIFEVVIDDAGVLKEEAAPAAAVEEMNRQIADLKGLVLTGTMTERYFTRKIEAKIPPGTSVEKRESMEQMKEAFANTEFILPEEAIGLGAKWEIKKKTKEQGINVDETIRHEVVALDGETLIVKSFTTQSAANQKIPNPIMPALKVDMTKMTGTATETATIDLTKTLPIQATVEQQSEINMSMNNAGTKQAMTMKSETRSTMTAE